MGNSVTQPFVTENVMYHLKTLPEEFSVYLEIKWSFKSIAGQCKRSMLRDTIPFLKEISFI